MQKLVINQFRSGEIRVFITSDLYAKHIVDQSVDLFINYKFPERNIYFLRIGRMSCFDSWRTAISFVLPEDEIRFSKIKSHFKI